MTHPTKPTVKQEDREAARSIAGSLHTLDALPIAVQAFARHREAAEASAREKALEALTPSAETKAAYVGEFQFSVPDFGNPAGHRFVEVPWTTIKEIMAAIKARAISTPSENT